MRIKLTDTIKVKRDMNYSSSTVFNIYYNGHEIGQALLIYDGSVLFEPKLHRSWLMNQAKPAVTAYMNALRRLTA